MPNGSNQKPPSTAVRVQTTRTPVARELRHVVHIFAALDLQDLLSAAPGIGLDEIQDAALLSRLDSKFVVREAWLPELISAVLKAGEHRVLAVNGVRQTTYDNSFLDTPELRCFQAHTRGRKDRYKARIRRYRSNGRTFLEVKHKTVHGRTIKQRWERAGGADWDAPLTAEERAALAEAFPFAAESVPVMSSAFERFTLVAPERAERFTVDTGLTFRSADGFEANLPGCAIIEMKQQRIDRRSPLFNALAPFRGAHPPLGRTTRVSKYIVGTALTRPEQSVRTYRPVIRELERTFLP